MTLQLYNSLHRRVEAFSPADAARVTVYGCGPTIYDHAHIGNFRTFMAYDLLRRALESRGFEVDFVVNFTDVDDKTIDGAAGAGVQLSEYTRPFGEVFLADAEALGIRPFSSNPHATEYIDEMIGFVQRLVEKDHAYVAEDGSVYFRIASFPEYGALSGNRPTGDQTMVSRITADEYSKDDVRDFVLWKSAKDVDVQVGAAWDSPWGKGRPGWHLECSVMSTDLLGDTVDIHVGGEDLLFPHHENEIAQSECATGHPFVRYWLHVKHLQLEGRKMSKSLGNFITVRDLLEEGVEAAAIRHQLLSAHYRSELNFTREGLAASGRAVQKVLDFQGRLSTLWHPDEGEGDTIGLSEIAETALCRFDEALDRDLNVPEALSALFTMIGDVNRALDEHSGPVELDDAQAVSDALEQMDRVLGVMELAKRDRAVDFDLVGWIQERIDARNAARAERNFAQADAIRDELAERGIVLEDSTEGTRWKRVHGGG